MEENIEIAVRFMKGNFASRGMIREYVSEYEGVGTNGKQERGDSNR